MGQKVDAPKSGSAAWKREYDAAKPIVAARSRGKCERGGERCTVQATQFHHKIGRLHPLANWPGHIDHLCLNDHTGAKDSVHGSPGPAYEDGWLLHYEDRPNTDMVTWQEFVDTGAELTVDAFDLWIGEAA